MNGSGEFGILDKQIDVLRTGGILPEKDIITLCTKVRCIGRGAAYGVCEAATATEREREKAGMDVCVHGVTTISVSPDRALCRKLHVWDGGIERVLALSLL